MKQRQNKVHNILNIRAIIDDAKCFETVRGLRWPHGVRCVHCDADSVVKHGRDETQSQRQRYRCRSCGRCFDDLTGTIFEGHHQPLAVWILCLYVMGLNLSNRQIALELDLNTSDVQQMTQQLRQGVVVRKPGVKLDEEVECDEVYGIIKGDRFIFLEPLASAESREQKAYPMGIVPQQSATKLARLWIPILKYLGEKSGLTLRFKTAPDIPTFERRLATGAYDLTYMNPYHYTVFHEAPGYLAFARAAEQAHHGYYRGTKGLADSGSRGFGGPDSGVPGAGGLRGQRAAARLFRSEGIEITPKYVNSHDSVYRSVAKGLYAAEL